MLYKPILIRSSWDNIYISFPSFTNIERPEPLRVLQPSSGCLPEDAWGAVKMQPQHTKVGKERFIEKIWKIVMLSAHLCTSFQSINKYETLGIFPLERSGTWATLRHRELAGNDNG